MSLGSTSTEKGCTRFCSGWKEEPSYVNRLFKPMPYRHGHNACVGVWSEGQPTMKLEWTLVYATTGPDELGRGVAAQKHMDRVLPECVAITDDTRQTEPSHTM